MAHVKASSSSKNGRDSKGRRLGFKHFGGEFVVAGNIILRQRGTKFYPGTNVGIGKDHSLYSLCDGHVFFKTQNKKKKIHVKPCLLDANSS